MDQDVKRELEEIREISEENNRMLHSMRRSARIGMFIRAIYWLIILGAAVGAFYYLQPYLDSLLRVYKNVEQTQQRISSFPTSWDGIKNYFSSTSTPQR